MRIWLRGLLIPGDVRPGLKILKIWTNRDETAKSEAVFQSGSFIGVDGLPGFPGQTPYFSLVQNAKTALRFFCSLQTVICYGRQKVLN
jgi:hypothetical protein